MGREARANMRSVAGGKLRASVAFHRLWRMVDFYQGDHTRFVDYLDAKQIAPAPRAALEMLWAARYPPLRVALPLPVPVNR